VHYPKSMLHSARLCYLEALKSGTPASWTVVTASCIVRRDRAGEIGLRVNLRGPMWPMRQARTSSASRAENRALIHSHHGSQNGVFRLWMGLSTCFYCTAEALRRSLCSVRRDYGVGHPLLPCLRRAA